MATPASPLAAARRGLAVAVASIVALGAASFAFLRPTNFRGYDEWVIASLLSRGILSFPHANRPLNLIWHVPAWLPRTGCGASCSSTRPGSPAPESSRC